MSGSDLKRSTPAEMERRKRLELAYQRGVEAARAKADRLARIVRWKRVRA